MKEDYAPVVVFGYNRADHLRQALEALSQADDAKETSLWIFCDGPKPGQDPARVLATRSVARDLQWEGLFTSVTVVVAEENKGLARSVIGGVSLVLDGAPSVIVLEDDLIVAPDFLRFMNDCLKFYRHEAKIGTVAGFCPLKGPPPGYAHDVYAVPRNCSKGWGIWKERWNEIDWEARDAWRLWRQPAFRRSFTSAGAEQLYRLWRQLHGKIDSWSIRVDLWLTLTGRYAIYPVHNRILDIGFDGSGVHTSVGESINDVISTTAQPYSLTHPAPDPIVLEEFKVIYSGRWPRRVLRSLRDRFLRLPAS